MKCTSCGASLQSKSNICVYCGTMNVPCMRSAHRSDAPPPRPHAPPTHIARPPQQFGGAHMNSNMGIGFGQMPPTVHTGTRRGGRSALGAIVGVVIFIVMMTIIFPIVCNTVIMDGCVWEDEWIGGGWGDVGIELDQTSLHLGVGESQRVWAFVFGTANHNVRWETANALYATVDEGSITAHRTGFVVIRAIPLANQSQWAEVSVWIGEGNVVPVVHSFTFTEDAINYNIRAYVRMTNRANFAVSVHFRFLSFDLNDGQNFRTGYNLHALRIEANDYWDGFFTFQILRTFATPRRLEISYLRYVPLP